MTRQKAVKTELKQIDLVVQTNSAELTIVDYVRKLDFLGMKVSFLTDPDKDTIFDLYNMGCKMRIISVSEDREITYFIKWTELTLPK